MTTGQRIKERRKELGISADSLAELLGVSRSTVFRYENGNIEKLPITILEPIADLLKTTPAFLMGWDSDNNYDIDFSKNTSIISTPKFKMLPLLGTIACGEPILAIENIDCNVECPTDIKADFALECKGDSMINARILDGDIVFIKMMSDVENGEIAAVLIDEEATLKRVYKQNNKLVLQPENPAYAPLVYTEDEYHEIRILGKAIAFLSYIR